MIGAADRYLGRHGRPKSGPLARLLDHAHAETDAVDAVFTVAPWLANVVCEGHMRRGLMTTPGSFTTDSVAVNCCVTRIRRAHRWVDHTLAADCDGKVYDGDKNNSFPSTHVDDFKRGVNGAYAHGVLDGDVLRDCGAETLAIYDPGVATVLTGVKASLRTFLGLRGNLAQLYQSGDFEAGPNRKEAGVRCGSSFVPRPHGNGPGEGAAGAAAPADGSHSPDAEPPAPAGGQAAAATVPVPAAAAATTDQRGGARQGGGRRRGGGDGHGAGGQGAWDRGATRRGRGTRGWRKRRRDARARHQRRRAEGCEEVTYCQIPKHVYLSWAAQPRQMSAFRRAQVVQQLRDLKWDLSHARLTTSQRKRKTRAARWRRRWLQHGGSRTPAVQQAVEELETLASRYTPDAAAARVSITHRLGVILDRSCYWAFYGSVQRRREAMYRAQRRSSALAKVADTVAPRGGITAVGAFGGRRANRAERGRTPTKAVNEALKAKTRLVFVGEHLSSVKCPMPSCQAPGTRAQDKSTHPTSRAVRRRKHQVERAMEKAREEARREGDPDRAIHRRDFRFLPFRKKLTATMYCSTCRMSMHRDLRAAFSLGKCFHDLVVENRRPAFLCSQQTLDRRAARAAAAAVAAAAAPGGGGAAGAAAAATATGGDTARAAAAATTGSSSGMRNAARPAAAEGAAALTRPHKRARDDAVAGSGSGSEAEGDRAPPRARSRRLASLQASQTMAAYYSRGGDEEDRADHSDWEPSDD